MRYNIILIALFTMLSISCVAQENQVLSTVIKSNLKFEKLKGGFEPQEFEIVDNQKTAFRFRFSNKTIAIQYNLPKQSELSGTSCGYFTVNNSVVKMSGLFPNDFACELDISSMNVYTTKFAGKNYLLVSAINKGSGLSASAVTINLFDITNPKNVLYYPLWSMYGSTSCIGDFDHNGVLDFLQVRSTGKDSMYKIELTSLAGSRFISSKKNYYMIVKRKGEGVKLISKQWF